ncbi:MAG TPA: hypothetical protein VMH00_01780 [Candidatus Limnocylindrales bacterium]|nr:hypothetical protein [Candidatus Limnocylindrales bacterium]
MKAFLMHRDEDFDVQQPSPWNVKELTQDLDLDVILHAMAGDDDFILEVARKALVCATNNDIETILYRHEALKDCLRNEPFVEEMYQLVVNAIETTRKHTWGITGHYPGSMVYGATGLLESLVAMLRELRNSATVHANRFRSEAFTTMFKMLERELSEEYLAAIADHLVISKFKKGVLMSSQLGEFNESTNFVLRKAADRKRNWFERLLRKGSPGHTFRLHERDEAGARIVSEMRNRGISRVAVALAESADHVLSFFRMLRTELAFYVACIHLHQSLVSKQMTTCFPVPAEAGTRRLRFAGLYDVSLSLRMTDKVRANTTDADGKDLIIITGANQGGKSSFLRSVGVAQLMMQCGMFVGAENFEGEVSPALLTHYKREEDATMESGKFDEELSRMNQIIERIRPNVIILFNESFAATNGREGSEIARQIVSALLEKQIRILYVTHLYEFAKGFFDTGRQDALFLRAEREPDGRRTFQLRAAGPLDTSYGEDLYREVFETGDASSLAEPSQTLPVNGD